MKLTNWARNVTFAPEQFEEPESLDHLQRLIAKASPVRVLGTGHSFSAVAATDGLMVSLARLPRTIRIDPGAGTVTVSAGARYGDLMGPLHAAGLALHNTGSLPHISVAGACATGTHGSGSANGSLATAVVELEFIGPDGTVNTLRRGHPDFPGCVVALGLCGVVTALTLRTKPTYRIRQFVYDNLPLDALIGDFDAVMDSAYSVSAFTRWREPVAETVWRKQLAEASVPPSAWMGARLATEQRHPIAGMPVGHATEQLGDPGPWHRRLPHFRLDFTPSSGAEIQSEYLLPRRHAATALKALSAVRASIAPALQVCEIRTVAADDLWLSPAYQRPSVALHFTWINDAAAAAAAVAVVEEALGGLDPRPHWGKVFGMSPDHVRDAFPRIEDFEALVHRIDPAGKFTNAFTDRFIRTS
ncbi:MAG: FAD-binding protein [Streptomyces sp.]|nr:FAD-binding protein [Streptomyces sp.]